MDSVDEKRKMLQDTINLYSFILNLDDKYFEIVRRMAVDFARLGVEPREIHAVLDDVVKARRYETK
jgi:hypothetical protein